MKKARIRIIHLPDGLYEVQQLVSVFFGLYQRYKFLTYASSLENAEFRVDRFLNPVVKEYE